MHIYIYIYLKFVFISYEEVRDKDEEDIIECKSNQNKFFKLAYSTLKILPILAGYKYGF